ncbi:hypothetical protein PROFUN_02306 [Planoprotostelium fungivorum]|uniref:Uncharacterized protein n=1 Tax=Planoprotostelium fungivorum TaxID=1890364 RepID=A0A2P6NYN6_9EUKA|nr:hypothetical protein PROFUN_02306 [Planoprotostelium fungivorum]
MRRTLLLLCTVSVCLAGAFTDRASLTGDLYNYFDGNDDGFSIIRNILRYREGINGDDSDDRSIGFLNNFIGGKNHEYGILNDYSIARYRDIARLFAMASDPKYKRIVEGHPLIFHQQVRSIRTVKTLQSVTEGFTSAQFSEFISRVTEGSCGTVSFGTDGDFNPVFGSHPVHYVVDSRQNFIQIQDIAGTTSCLDQIVSKISPTSFVFSFNSTGDCAFKSDRRATFPASLGPLGTFASSVDKFFGDFSSVGFDVETEEKCKCSASYSIMSPILDPQQLKEGYEYSMVKYNQASAAFEKIFSIYDETTKRLFHFGSGGFNFASGAYGFVSVQKATSPIPPAVDTAVPAKTTPPPPMDTAVPAETTAAPTPDQI